MQQRGIVCARERGDFACNLGVCGVLMVELEVRLHSQECSILSKIYIMFNWENGSSEVIFTQKSEVETPIIHIHLSKLFHLFLSLIVG